MEKVSEKFAVLLTASTRRHTHTHTNTHTHTHIHDAVPRRSVCVRLIAQASVKSIDLVVTSGEVNHSLFKNMHRLLRWIIPFVFFSHVRFTLPDPIMAFGVTTCQQYKPLSSLTQGILLLRSWLCCSRWKWKARILSPEAPGLRQDRST